MEKQILLKTEVKLLLDLTKSLKELFTEVRFNLNKEGLNIIEIDQANVCLFEANINKSQFQQITENEEIKSYGVNIDSLYKILKEHKESVLIETDDHKLYFRFDNGIISELYLIEIEAEKKKFPDYDFDVKVELESKRFREILKHFCSNSDSVIFETKEDFKNREEDYFKIYSDTGLNNSEIELKDFEVKIEGNGKSKYSTEYLKKFIKIIYSEKTLLRFANEHPLIFEQGTENFKIKFLLAPKITETD